MYKTPEGKAARKIAEAIDGVEFSAAMMASCFTLQGGEPMQNRFAEVIIGQIEQWFSEGRMIDDSPMGRLMAMWQSENNS